MKKQIVLVTGSVVSVSYPTIGKSVKFDTSRASAQLKQDAMFHGFKQALGDSASGGTPLEKFTMASRRVAAFESGSWELTERAFDPSLCIEAVARVKSRESSEIEATLSDMDDEEKIAKVKEWSTNDKVKAAIATIRAERLQSIADEADELEIEGLED